MPSGVGYHDIYYTDICEEWDCNASYCKEQTGHNCEHKFWQGDRCKMFYREHLSMNLGLDEDAIDTIMERYVNLR